MKAGKTKQRIARLLSKSLETAVDPEHIWVNRNAEQAGCARWGVWVIIGGQNTNVYSWDTMTECLQKGFVLLTEGVGLMCVTVNDPA